MNYNDLTICSFMAAEPTPDKKDPGGPPDDIPPTPPPSPTPPRIFT